MEHKQTVMTITCENPPALDWMAICQSWADKDDIQDVKYNIMQNKAGNTCIVIKVTGV